MAHIFAILALRSAAASLALLANEAGAASAAGLAAPQLDDLIAFADPAMCYPMPATLALLGAMVGGSGDTLRDDWIVAGTIPPEHADRLGPVTMTQHDGWRSVRTAVNGTLWGLPLVAIYQEFPEGGDSGGFSFEFAAPPRVVERAVRRRGFPARAGRSVQMGPPDALAYEIGLHRAPDAPGHALLSCGYGG